MHEAESPAPLNFLSPPVSMSIYRRTWPSSPGPTPGVRVKASNEDLRRFAADFFSRFSESEVRTSVKRDLALCQKRP